MKIYPAPDNLIIKGNKELDTIKTRAAAFGLELADINDENDRPMVGNVLEVGVNAQKNGYNVGDKVVFSQFSPIIIEIEDEEYLVLSYKDLLARIEY